MGKPAARIGDLHDCKMVAPGGVPHVGGPVIGEGCQTVLIDGKPAATVGDSCTCVGALDKITTGSTGVFFEGRPAARQGDRCAHGGVITGGSGTVVIGEWLGEAFYKIGDEEDKEEFVELFSEEKRLIIDQAIKDCIALLERKLALMEQADPTTQEAFMKWFGKNDDEAKQIIIERIRRALEVGRTLTVENFDDRSVEQEQENLHAEVYPLDKSYKIFVNHLFWQSKSTKKDSKAGIIIHELSHFEDIGNTKDYTYGKLCLKLAKFVPNDAIYNADNFEYFIVC